MNEKNTFSVYTAWLLFHQFLLKRITTIPFFVVSSRQDLLPKLLASLRSSHERSHEHKVNEKAKANEFQLYYYFLQNMSLKFKFT